MSWSRRYSRRLYYYGAGAGFTPGQLTKVAKWIRLDDRFDVGSASFEIPDALGGTGLTQPSLALQPTFGTSNGFPVMGPLTGDVLEWIHDAPMNQATKAGIAFWAFDTSITTGTLYLNGGATYLGVNRFSAGTQPSASNRITFLGAQNARSVDTPVAGAWYFWTLEYDGTLSPSIDRLKMTVNGVAIPHAEFSGSIPSSLPMTTPDGLKKWLFSGTTDTGGGTARLTTGANIYWINGHLTPDERSALMTFEPPV